MHISISPEAEVPIEARPRWSLGDFLGNLSATVPLMGMFLIITGFVILIFGGISLIRKIIGTAGVEVSFIKVVMQFLIGGAAMLIGQTVLYLNTPDEANDDPDPQPAPEPESSTTAAPSPSAEPIDWTIPATIGIIAGTILVIALVAYVIYRIVVSIRAHRALQRQEQAQLELAQRRIAAQWSYYEDTHDDIKHRILETETDWDTIFKYPSLSDPTVPETRQLWEAVSRADHLRTPAPTSLLDDESIPSMPYPTAVIEAKHCWDVAFTNAKRTGQKNLPATERKTIEQIQQLLALAKSPGAESERRLAYQRASKLIDQLTIVVVPKLALEILEQVQQQMIEQKKPSGDHAVLHNEQHTLDHSHNS